MLLNSAKLYSILILSGLAAVCIVQAQEPLGNAKALQRSFDDHYKRRVEILRGETPPTKADDKIAESAAQYYVYRITHGGDPAKLQKEFEGFADDVARAKSDGAKKFAEMLAPHFVTCMKQLLDRDIRAEPQLVIVGSMMLPAVARLRQEKSNDYLIELVQNPKTHDVIRLNALKALRESMPITPIDEDTDLEVKGVIARIDFDTKNVSALTKFIDRPAKFKNLPPELVAVTRFVRREAITSLAQAGSPAVVATKKKIGFKPAKREFQYEGLVAPTLLRVLAEKLDPPPSLQEKLEAAHGICNFKYPKMAEYNPELGIFLVGRTLEDLVNSYNQDLTNIIAEQKKLPTIGYKTEAKRFQIALASLADGAKNTPARANADKLAAAYAPIFKTMSIYASTDPDKMNTAVKTTNAMRPRDGLIFKGAKIAVDLQ